MKKHLLIILVLLTVAFFSCKEEDVFGDTFVYMPQATRNIGTDNNLLVDLSTTSPTGDTAVVLGVYRSGLQPLEEFSVEMAINADTVAQAITAAAQPGAPEVYDIYKTGVLLPSSYYDPLPAQLTVSAGNREATTELILKKSAMINDFAAGSILLLPVEIMNPSKYKLNNDFTLTMVVIRIN